MLDFDKVDFSYDDKTRLFDQFSCSIENKQVSCIIGINGAGKSTFAKLAVGLLTPQGGTVLYNDKPLSALSIGYLQQTLNLSHSIPISLINFVMMGCIRKNRLFFTKYDTEKALHVIEQCGLEEKRHEPVKYLSGGQKQKALIARILISDPQYIVLDEPFEALDVNASRTLYEQLLELKTQMTIVMISHNLEMITKLADKIFCISNQKYHHDYLTYFSAHSSIPVEHSCSTHVKGEE